MPAGASCGGTARAEAGRGSVDRGQNGRCVIEPWLQQQWDAARRREHHQQRRQAGTRPPGPLLPQHDHGSSEFGPFGCVRLSASLAVGCGPRSLRFNLSTPSHDPDPPEFGSEQSSRRCSRGLVPPPLLADAKTALLSNILTRHYPPSCPLPSLIPLLHPLPPHI